MRARSVSAFALFALASCDAPHVDIAEDASIEASIDAAAPFFPDATKTFLDGRVCWSHEEDNDESPDDCDDCPGVKDRTRIANADGIGVACAPNVDGFSFRRKLFDPMTEVSARWRTSGAAGFRATGTDDWLGGETTGEIGFATLVDGYYTQTPLVVTSSFQNTGCLGGAPDQLGVFVRGSFGAQFFVGCSITGRNVVVVAPDPATGGCGKTCTLQEIGARVGFPSQVSSPVLRAIAQDTPGGGGNIRCIVTDAQNPDLHETVATQDIPAARWGVDDPMVDRRGVGLFAQRCKMRVHWFELMTSTIAK